MAWQEKTDKASGRFKISEDQDLTPHDVRYAITGLLRLAADFILGWPSWSSNKLTEVKRARQVHVLREVYNAVAAVRDDVEVGNVGPSSVRLGDISRFVVREEARKMLEDDQLDEDKSRPCGQHAERAKYELMQQWYASHGVEVTIAELRARLAPENWRETGDGEARAAARLLARVMPPARGEKSYRNTETFLTKIQDRIGGERPPTDRELTALEVAREARHQTPAENLREAALRLSVSYVPRPSFDVTPIADTAIVFGTRLSEIEKVVHAVKHCGAAPPAGPLPDDKLPRAELHPFLSAAAEHWRSLQGSTTVAVGDHEITLGSCSDSELAWAAGRIADGIALHASLGRHLPELAASVRSVDGTAVEEMFGGMTEDERRCRLMERLVRRDLRQGLGVLWRQYRLMRVETSKRFKKDYPDPNPPPREAAVTRRPSAAQAKRAVSRHRHR